MIYERNFFLTGIFLQVYRLGVNVSFMFFAYRKSKNSLKFQCIQGDKDKNLTTKINSLADFKLRSNKKNLASEFLKGQFEG